MRIEDFQKIAEKISKGDASEEEVAVFNAYYNYIQRQEGTGDLQSDGFDLNETEKELYGRIRADLPGREEVKQLKLRVAAPYFKIAAAVAVLLLSVWFLAKDNEVLNSAKPLKTASRFKNDVLPGSNKAVLVLANGSQIALDDSGNGLLARQGNTSIRKAADGKLVYEAGRSANGKTEAGRSLMNSVSTPKGGQYQLTLPDGTKVWLNSASTLRFPAVFNGGERLVELDGEAYFEVASQSRAVSAAGGRSGERIPFRVKTRAQLIDVLGTHFNVSAYTDEIQTKTTLLEGSVKVTVDGSAETKSSGAGSAVSRILRPGQQSRVTAAAGQTGSGPSAIAVSTTDPEEAVAWKNGMFQFNNTDIYTIMKQLERWYGVEVDMTGMPQKEFNGIIPRSVKLSQVLTMMEKTSGLKFRIEGRRVSMMK